MKSSPSLLLSSAFAGAVAILFLAGYAYFGLRLEVLLLGATLAAALVGTAAGFSWRELQEEIVRSIFEGMPSMLIVLAVGALVASWLASGTIPFVVHLGLACVPRSFFLVSATVIAAVVSLLTGTAYGTLGTVGVAFLAIAQAFGIPAAPAAGALVGGAYIGQKISPFSANATLAASVARISVYEHIRHSAWTTVPAAAVAIAAYALLPHESAGAPDPVAAASLHHLDTALRASFRFNAWVLAPAVVSIAGPMLRKPLLPVIFASSATAVLIAIFVQGAAPAHALNALVAGFDLSQHDPLLRDILRQGGLRDMLPLTLIAMLAFAFSGIVRKVRILDPLLVAALRFTTTARRLVAAAAGACLAAAAITGSSFVSIVLPMQLFGPEFARQKLAPANLSRIAGDSAVGIVPLLPWTIAGAFLTRMLGVPPAAYAPWAVACYAGLFFTLLFGAAGFTMTPLAAGAPRSCA